MTFENLIIVLITSFLGTTVGMSTTKLIFKKITEKVFSGINVLVKNTDSDTRQVSELKNAVEKFTDGAEEILTNVSKTLASHTSKLEKYEKLIEYYQERDRKIIPLLRELLEDKKEE